MHTNVGPVERWLSAAGGSALALFGLSRRGLSRAALTVAGGALAYRGFTGHCPVYEALGIDRGRPPEAAERPDIVEEASQLSFPASDAPAWTPTVGSATH